MAKIAFITDAVYPWHVGGVEALEYKEMLALSKKHEVYCFCLQFNGMKKRFVKDGIRYICVYGPVKSLYTKSGKRSVSLAMRFGSALLKELGKYDFDLIYANAFPYFHLSATKRYCKKHETKLVLDVTEVWSLKEWKGYLGMVKGLLGYRYMKSALFGADLYVSVSSSTSNRLIALGIPEHRIRTFAPILNLDKISRYRSKKMRLPRVILAGRFIKEKGFDEWVNAVASAHSISDKINGLIIGDGPEYKRISELINSKDLRFISITGSVKDQSILYRKIANSAVLLQTSHREGLSIIVLESLALGTPVILPDYTPIPKEVKRMCIVLPLKKIPETIVGIVSSPDKSQFLKNIDRLKDFDEKGILHFFDSVIVPAKKDRGRAGL